jgi:hypothetical protein
MPEPIRSTSPSQHDTSLTPAADPPRTEAGIVTMALVQAPISLSELAVDCAGKASQLAAAGTDLARNPLSAGLALVSATWELLDCAATYRHNAEVQATIIECTKRGGMPIGILENSVNCQGAKP